MTDLKRQLGLLDSTMINVGTIIASAIFIVPSTIVLHLTASGPAILVWIVGGCVSLLGALSVAELGAAMPKAGGQYVYLTEAYGPVWGYLYGWTSGVVINPASIAAIAVGFATYLTFFVPLADAGIKAVAVLSIIGLTALNCLGVKLGALTQNILTLIKMGLLTLLDRKSTRLNSSHGYISYAVFCLKKKKTKHNMLSLAKPNQALRSHQCV